MAAASRQFSCSRSNSPITNPVSGPPPLWRAAVSSWAASSYCLLRISFPAFERCGSNWPDASFPAPAAPAAVPAFPRAAKIRVSPPASVTSDRNWSLGRKIKPRDLISWTTFSLSELPATSAINSLSLTGSLLSWAFAKRIEISRMKKARTHRPKINRMVPHWRNHY